MIFQARYSPILLRIYKPIISGRQIVKRTSVTLSLKTIDKIINLNHDEQDKL